MNDNFDYIIVGGGSAGCVLANRLSADPQNKVLLIEAGGSGSHWSVDMPLGVAAAIKSPKRNWQYQSEPEPGLNGRRIDHPRGRLLGGSSSINGMVYSRGHALDYDRWATEYGCEGWSYADLLPYFRRAESYQGGQNEYRGGEGPLKVTIPDLSLNPLNQAFIEAGQAAGYEYTPDQNGFRQEGFGINETTISGGRRFGTRRAYLLPAQSRPNLSVLTDCLVERILIENGRATGVEFSRNGSRRQVLARKETLLSAGAIGSPQLLMLSGVGPSEHLMAHGIEVKVDLPGVGQNLQDHPDLAVQQWCSAPVSLYDASRGLGKIRTGLQWFLGKSGVGASNQFHASAFVRSSAGVQYPDIKLEFFPLAVGEDLAPVPGHAYQIHVTLMRAHSRGHLQLTSADVRDRPSMLFNYLTDPRDIVIYRNAVRLAREIIAQPPLARLSGEEIEPGAAVQSDAELDAWIRANAATAYHPSCTCRMGDKADANAVLTPDLKVRGVEGLRVVDASAMPHVTNSNTNAPTIMMAEKASDLILGHTVARSNAPYWVHPDWENEQR